MSENSESKAKRIICIAVSAMIICPVLFTAPFFGHGLGFLDSGPIGDTIGGITAPIVGLCSVILLYYTLEEQAKFNRNQMEFNITQTKDNLVTHILSLQSEIIQMDARLDILFYSSSDGEISEVKGIEALSLVERTNSNSPYMTVNQYVYLKNELNVFLSLCEHYYRTLKAISVNGSGIDSTVIETYLKELDSFWNSVKEARVDIRPQMDGFVSIGETGEVETYRFGLEKDAVAARDRISHCLSD